MSHLTPGDTALLFDLDGTLTDPSEGITKSMQHALASLGRPYPDRAELKQYIGPPLRWTFPRLLGSHDEDLVETAVRHFRERYGDVGLFENEVYPGIPEMLGSLHGHGYRLYVVTSKPRIYADRILHHFGLGKYFIEVYGPELSGHLDDKQELVGFVLGALAAGPERTTMIGDRARDIASGKAHGTRTVGVTYGFGSEEELATAGCDFICHSPAEIHRVVTGRTSGRYKSV